MPGKNRMDFQIGFKTDQSSVNAVKKSLQSIMDIKPTQFKGPIDDLRQVQDMAQKVSVALEKAFNPNLKTLNVSAFNQQLRSSVGSIDQMYQSFSKIGMQGQSAFNKMASSVLTTKVQLQQTKGILTALGETMFNTVKWGISSSIMNSFTSSIRQAFQYAKSLDGALTDIRIVTGDSTEQMRQFAQEANKAAQNLGRSTMDYTKAALTFYQQGLNDEEVKTRTETVLKAQNITGAGDEMADYLTAVWNGYKVANEEAELYVDKLAAVADSSASNMSQLAIAMSKVASSANLLGVPVDKLNAQIATITATTRQAPESVGNALKTIYSRINDIATGAQDAQVSLGNYSKQMLQVGISVLDSNGKLRDTGDVIDEIGAKWGTLSHEQQIFLARTMAGQRQYNNLLALFENWGKYTDLVNVSMEAQGTTMEKNSRYMDSLEAKLEQLGAASEKVKDALINEQSLKGLASAGANIVNLFGNIIQSIGGGGGALLTLASSLTGLFSGVISKEINNIVINLQNARKIGIAFQNDLKNTQLFGQSKGMASPAVDAMVQAKRELGLLYRTLSVDQLNYYNGLVQQVGATEDTVQKLKEKKDQAQKFYQIAEQRAGRRQNYSVEDQIGEIERRAQDVLAQTGAISVGDLSEKLKAKEASKDIDQLKEELKAMQEQASEANKALEESKKTIEELKQSATDKEDKSIISEYNQELKPLQQRASSAGKAVEELKEKISAMEKQFQEGKKATDTIEDLKKKMQALQAELGGNAAKETFTPFYNALKEIEEKGDSSAAAVQRLKKVADEIAGSFSNGMDAARGLKEITFEYQNAVAKADQAKQAAQNYLNTLKQYQGIKGIVDTTAAIGRFASAVTSLSNIKNIWSNQALSSGQKFLQTLTSIGMAVPMLMTSFATLSKTFKTFATTAKTVTTIQEAAALLQQKQNALTTFNIALRKVSNTQKGKQLSLDEAIKIAKEANVTLTGKQTTVQGIKIAITKAHTAALKEQQEAQKSLNAAMLANPWTWVVIGAIAAIAGAIAIAYAAYTQAERMAEKAKKKAEQAREAYNAIKETVNELKNGFQNLANAKSNLAELTAGTEEWKQALQDVNSQVLELIQKYPELKQFLTSDSNGMLGFKQGAQETVKGIYRQRQLASAMTYAQAEQTSAQANNRYLITQQSRKISGVSAAQLTEVVQAINTHGSGILESQGRLAQALGDNTNLGESQRQAVINASKAVNDLAKQVKNNVIQAKNLSQSLSNSAFSNYQTYKDSQNKQVLSKLANQYIKDAGLNTQKYTTTVEVTGIGVGAGAFSGPRYVQSKDRQAIFKAYEEYFGKVIEQGVWGALKIDGKEVSQEWIQSQVANYQASLEANQYLRKANQQIKKWGPELTRLYTSVYQGVVNLESLSKKDLDRIAAEKDTEFGKQFKNALGIKTDQQFQTWLNNAKQEITKNTETYLASLTPSVRQALQSLNPEELSLQVQGTLSSILKKAFVEGKGVENLQDQIAEVLSAALGADKLDQLLQIDVSDLSLDDFRQSLKELGIQTNISDKALIAFIRTMRGLPGEGEKTADQIYNTIHKVIDKKNGKTLQYNDQIDEETYNDLKKAGVQVEDSFKRINGGMYKFVGVAEEFYKRANQVSIQPFLKQIDQLRQRKNELKNEAPLPRREIQELSKDSIQTEHRFRRGEHVQYQKINYDLLEKQVNMLQKMDLLTDQELANSRDLINFRTDDLQLAKKINEKIKQNEDQLGNYLKLANQAVDKKLYDKQLSQAYSAQDLGQLTDLSARGTFKELWSSEEGLNDYAQALVNVADAQGLEADTVKALGERFKTQAKSLDFVSDALQGHTKECYQVAAAMQDMVTGIQAIQKDWKQTIKQDVEPGTEVFAKTKQVISDMFNQDVGESFISKHLSQIERIAQGDLTAVQELGNALAILNMQDVVKVRPQLNTEEFNNEILAFQDILANTNFDNIEVGAYIDEAPFYQALNDFIQNSGASVEQINKILSGIGYFPNVEMVSVPLSQVVASDDGAHYIARGKLVDGTPFEQTVSTAFYDENATTSQITIPVIKGSKFAGGAGNLGRIGGNRVTPKSAGSGKGKGGGGGGGKGKTAQTIKPQKESKPQKHVDERSDIYHDINLALEKQNKLLDDIQEKEEYLTKLERIDSLKEQNKQIEKQIDLLQEKADIAESQAIRLRNELTADLGEAISFNADGTIANYNQALDTAIGQYNTAIDVYNEAVRKAEQEYNKYVDKYNAMSAEQQESNKQKLEEQKDAMQAAKQAAKDQLDVEKEKFDQIKENVKGYEDTLGIIDDMNDQIQDALRKIKENNLEGIKLQVELKLDTGEFERQYLDFEQKFVKKLDENDFIGGTKALIKRITSYFDSEEINQLADKIKFANEEIAKLTGGGQSDYFNGLGQAQEVLQEYTSELMEKLGDIQDLVDEINQNYLTALDDAKDKMDQQIQQYERVGDLIEHNMKMVELMYGDKAYATMQKYYNQQRTNDQKQLQSLRNQQLFWQEQMSKEIVGTDAWQKAKQNVDDITDKLNSKLEDMVEKLADQFENRMNGIIENLNNSLSRGRGLDFIDQQWSDIENYDDKFLDVFNSRMGIDQVTRLYQDAIDGLSGSPANQQKLNKLMSDQLKMLKEKDHLTQYDLDRAKASLQVEKARMALEDSRYNKTKMRLRRDSQGNYTYQYVADEEKLSELQAALQDAQANLYNMDKQQYKQNLNDMYDAYKDYIQKMKTLTEKYNSTQDEAERARIAAQMDVVKEQYEQLWQGMAENSSVIFKNLRDSFTEGMGLDQTQYSAEQLTELMERLIPFVGSGLEDFTRVITSEGGLIPATTGAVQQLRQATIEYDEALNKTLADAGTSLETITEVTDAFGNALDNNILATQALITANEALIESCKAEVAEMKEMMQWLNSLLEGTYDLNQFVNQVREGYNTVQELNGSQVRADVIDVADNGLPKGENIFTGNAMQDAATLRQAMTQLIDEYEKYLQAMSIAQFDTGGMTGTWGDDSGRIAILHQKQLVLNQDDTANILAVIRQYRAMTQRLNTAAAGGIDAMAAAIAGQFGQLNSNSSFEQNVHIDAHFPNAVNHSEIEQAFNNLVNIASMRAARQGR